MNYPASGMIIRSCISFDGINYRVGNRRFANNSISYNAAALSKYQHYFVGGQIVYIGSGSYSESNPTKNKAFSWIATVSGRFSPTLKDGAYHYPPLTIQEQDNISAIIHSYYFEEVIDPESGNSTIEEGSVSLTTFAGIVSNSNEFLVTSYSNEQSASPELYYGFCSTDGGSNIVFASNLENLEEEELVNQQFVSTLLIKKYKGRYYSGQQGVRYIKDSGEVGKLSSDFSEMPNAIATAIYASETRGLVLTYGSTLKYFVITQN
ncbi:MAG: hypothetical protein AB4372_35655 [Xenococcus sp. (in: cyanobacteria)]